VHKAYKQLAALAENGKFPLTAISIWIYSRRDADQLTAVTPRRRRSSTWSGSSNHNRRASIASLKNIFKRTNSVDEEKLERSGSVDEEKLRHRYSLDEEKLGRSNSIDEKKPEE
jgi:hypothetical protein